MKKYEILLSPKKLTPIEQKFVMAKDQKEAETKAGKMVEDFKTFDPHLKETIKNAGGLEAKVTEVTN